MARLLEADMAAFTCPVRFELLSGVRPEEEADLEEALAFCRHFPFESEDWRATARLERQLRAQGFTLPRNDLFVATVAFRTGLTIACRDIHFDALRKVAGIRLTVEQI